MDLFTAICGNTFVGGTCALPSDLLVFFLLWPFLRACCLNVNEDTQCCELQKKQGWPIYIVLILITDFNPDLNQVIFVKKIKRFKSPLRKKIFNTVTIRDYIDRRVLWSQYMYYLKWLPPTKDEVNAFARVCLSVKKR